MSISVVIPTSRYRDALESCLDRLMAQRRLPEEVVVVAGEAQIRELAQRWQESRKPQFGLKLEKPNGLGAIAARNSGKDCATSMIVCFTRDDCLPDNNWLSRIEEDFEDPLVGAVGGPVIDVRDDVPRLTYTDNWGEISWWGRRIGNCDKVPRRGMLVRSLSTHNMVFRNYLLRDFDESLLGDPESEEDMCLAVRSMGFRVLGDPEVRVYRVHRRDTTRSQREAVPVSLMQAHHNNTYAFLKHSTLPQKMAFIPYTFALGDDRCPGLLKSLRRFLRQKDWSSATREIGLALRGNALGLRAYISHIKRRSKPYRH